jgi:quinol-cytochrome oxidoreductase complex cytochrome b subunit
MLASLLILLAMPVLDLGRFRGVQHRPVSKFILVTLAVSFFILLQIGSLHVEAVRQCALFVVCQKDSSIDSNILITLGLGPMEYI